MSWVARDLRHIWHPCSQMKDYETFPPLVIKGAAGCYLELEDGTKIIDAVSSWWCKSLGHGHPKIKAALMQQAERYEHVLGVNTCQDVLVKLSEKLCTLSPHLNKVFYASEGSSAVEVAIKMSVHAHHIQGASKRNKIMALQNAYHGETLLALSLSELGLYREAYAALLLPTVFLQHIPYVHSQHDPLWQDCSVVWPKIEQQLNAQAEELSAIIVEPILQGAGGMLIYSQDFLRRLCAWAKKNSVHLIADEIMTGFGRTGFALACRHAQIEPDFICLGKALTAGWLPMSAVLTSEQLYGYFYDDYAKRKSFLHSHTFSGNALAAAVALEALQIYEDTDLFKTVRTRETLMCDLMQEVARQTQSLHNVRAIGAMVAADLIAPKNSTTDRLGYVVFQEAVKRGALLRPLGNTIYWLPPLIASDEVLYALQSITIQAIQAVL